MKLIPAIAVITTFALGACADLAKLHPCYELTGSALQQCEAEVAARHAALAAKGGNNDGPRESLSDSKTRSGATTPGETNNSNSGGFGPISGRAAHDILVFDPSLLLDLDLDAVEAELKFLVPLS